MRSLQRVYGSLTIITDFGCSEISLNDPYCPGHPRAGTFFFCSSKEVSPLKPFGDRPRGRGPAANGVEIVEDGLRLKPKERVRLVSVAGLRDMILSERAAQVELTERRVTPKAVNIKTAIAFIQAHKFGGVQSTGRDGLLLISAVGHGDGQD